MVGAHPADAIHCGRYRQTGPPQPVGVRRFPFAEFSTVRKLFAVNQSGMKNQLSQNEPAHSPVTVNVNEDSGLKPSAGSVATDKVIVDPPIERARKGRHSLNRPSGLTGETIWMYILAIGLFHVVALLAFVPWFFTWTGLIVMLVGVHFFGDIGINLCYHRLLAHHSFRVPKWFERTLVVISVCCLQDTPIKWVTTHRSHHGNSDEDEDPHSPLVTFCWGHFEWIMLRNKDTRSAAAYDKYARDLLADPFYRMMERTSLPGIIFTVHALLYYFVGFGVGYYLTETVMGAVQFGLSLLLWGVIVRVVIVWHITWSVNSLTHMFGYRNHDTTDQSRNNWFVALVGAGEGWHNNHHHDQSSASVQHRWWEIDITYYTILLLGWLGLATDIIQPRHKRIAKRRKANSDE